MKFSELVVIQAALQQLASSECPEKYAIAKNLNIVNRLIKEIRQDASDLYDLFADKDTNGQLLYYERKVKDERGDEQMGKEKRISDLKTYAKYLEESKKMDNEDHEVKFHKVLNSKVEKFLNDPKTNSNQTAPLLDVIFVESIESEQASKTV